MKNITVALSALAVSVSLAGFAQNTPSGTPSDKGSSTQTSQEGTSSTQSASQSTSAPTNPGSTSQQGTSSTQNTEQGAAPSGTTSRTETQPGSADQQGSSTQTSPQGSTASQTGTYGTSQGQGTVSTDTSPTMDTGRDASQAKLRHLKGTIGEDGKTFTPDQGSKTWAIVNPDAVKGHEGHHVRLSAHVYPEKDSIHVMSLKMASKGKHADKSDKAPMSEQPQQ